MTKTMEIEMIASVKQPLARFAFAMVLMMSTLPIWRRTL